MASVFRPTYPKPLPSAAELVVKGGKQMARVREGRAVREYPVTSDGKGILRQASKWAGRYRDVDGKLRQVSLCTDKSASQAALDELVRLVDLIRAGRSAPPIEDIPPMVRPAVVEALEASGQTTKAHRLCRAPIEEALQAYLAHLRSKDATREHVSEVERVIRVLIDFCGFRSLADVAVGPITEWVAWKRGQKKGNSARNTNVHIDRLHAFIRWAKDDGRVERDSLEHLPRRNERRDRKRIARAMSEDEIVRLLDAARRRPVEKDVRGHRGRTLSRDEQERLGVERQLIYGLMLYAGARKKEVGKLEWVDVLLDQDEPVLMMREAVTKNTKKRGLPIHPWLAELLREWRSLHGGADATGSVVRVPSSLLRTLNRDLAFAGIPKADRHGHVVHLHACRHSFITMLGRVGVDLREAKELARHSKVTMTMDVYTHVLAEDKAQAVAALPAPGQGSSRHAREHAQIPCMPVPSESSGGTVRPRRPRRPVVFHVGVSRAPDTRKPQESFRDIWGSGVGRTGLEPDSVSSSEDSVLREFDVSGGADFGAFCRASDSWATLSEGKRLAALTDLLLELSSEERQQAIAGMTPEDRLAVAGLLVEAGGSEDSADPDAR